MGGNIDHGSNYPFTKTKIKMLPFAAYLDLELVVEQKFNPHLVPKKQS